MLGQDLRAASAARGPGRRPSTAQPLDITDADAVQAAVAEHRPDVVVNCAAWTAVDDAEAREAERCGSTATARATSPRPANERRRLLQVSTDYVFAGDAAAPVRRGRPDRAASAYGRTKLAGEQAVLDLLPDGGYVVRTAWLYGAGGGNFVRTMIRLEAVKDTLDVVDDQRGQPTWTADLADRLVRLGHGALAGTAPAGSTTAPARARRPGSASPGRSSRCSAPTRSGSARPPARPSPPRAAARLQRARPRPLGGRGIEPVRDWRGLAEAFPALVAAERGTDHAGGTESCGTRHIGRLDLRARGLRRRPGKLPRIVQGPGVRGAAGQRFPLAQANSRCPAVGPSAGSISPTSPRTGEVPQMRARRHPGRHRRPPVGSPTFRMGVRPPEVTNHRSVYLAEGLGHGFLALTDEATVVYLCSEGYAPSATRDSPAGPGSGDRLAERGRAAALGEGRRGTGTRRGAGTRPAPDVGGVPGVLHRTQVLAAAIAVRIFTDTSV